MALTLTHAPDERRWAATRRPIFIVGAARSGTTLLRSMLSAHPRIAISPETHFMRLADLFGARRADEPADFTAFWSAFERHIERRAISLDLERCRALLKDAGDFRGVFEAALAAQAERAGKPRIGEKTPGHEHYLARIFEWFPESHVIFVLRDPRGCAASTLHTPWTQEQLRPESWAAPLVRRLRLRHVAVAANEWARSHRAAQAHYADPRVTCVAYEDLVRTPEEELRRICTFLREDFAPEMLAARTCELIDPGKASLRWREWTLAHEARAAMAVSMDEISRWRRELTPHEAATVEALCAEGMREMRYGFSHTASARAAAEHRADWLLKLDKAEGAARDGLKRLFGRRGRRLPLLGASVEAQAAAAGLLACGL